VIFVFIFLLSFFFMQELVEYAAARGDVGVKRRAVPFCMNALDDFRRENKNNKAS
jgi:hypothetical protein